MGFHASGLLRGMADLSVFLSLYSVLMGIMPTPFDRFIGHVAVLLRSGVDVTIEADGAGYYYFTFRSADDYQTFKKWFDSIEFDRDYARYDRKDSASEFEINWMI